MSKSIHFSGQPMYGQLISLIDKEDVLKFSRKHNGERYVKHFDACQHLLFKQLKGRFNRHYLTYSALKRIFNSNYNAVYK